MSYVSKEMETKFNGILESFCLRGWSVVLAPDETQPRGKIQLEDQIILIHDSNEQDAMRTLLHEVLELKLRSLVSPYRSLTNLLIQWIDEEVYRIKERTIEELIPLLVRLFEVESPSLRKLEEAIVHEAQ